MTATIDLTIQPVTPEPEPVEPCPIARWCPNTNSENCDSGEGCPAC